MYDTEEERIEANKRARIKAQKKYRLKHGEAFLEKQRQWQKKYDAKKRKEAEFVIIEFPQAQEQTE